MRTKVLLGAVALAAACALTAKAQNVYSLNVVGYINVPLMDGWNLIANQLDLDGTGANNTLVTVLGSGVPLNTAASTWDPVAQNFIGSTYTSVKGAPAAWTTASKFNPGQGAWLQIPTGTFGTGVTGSVTTVGQVLQGSLTNAYLAPAGGWALLGNVVPIAGGLTSVLNYQAKVGDAVSLWDPSVQNFVGATYASVKGAPAAWAPTEPSIAIGAGFWLSASAGQTWSTNFTVQ